MDPNTISEKDSSNVLPVGEGSAREWPGVRKASATEDVRFPAEDGGKSLAEMAERDLDATLQLLAERAQYITAATGAAIALTEGEEMVCKASAGSSAPEVGALLQTDSGLSGESIRTRQTLRCDDAQTDGRVNRESCEALGIASVVVMPMIEGDEVVGVFELFSDHPHAFEDRDITALERLGFMVRTAIAQAEAARMPAQSGKTEAPGISPSVSVSSTQIAPGVGPEGEAAEKERASESPVTDGRPQVDAKSTAASREDEETVAEIRRHLYGEKATSKAAGSEPSTASPRIAFHMPARSTRVEAAVPALKDEQISVASAPEVHHIGSNPVPNEKGETERPREPETASEQKDASPESESDRPAFQAQPSSVENGAISVAATAESTAVSAGDAAPAPVLVSAKPETGTEQSKPPQGVSAAATTAHAEGSAPAQEAASSTLNFGTAIVPALNREPETSTVADAESKGHATARVATEISAPEISPAIEESSQPAPPTGGEDRARNAVAGLRRCESCGFPVSEGRKLCLDCEKKKPADRAANVKTAIAASTHAAAERKPSSQPETMPPSVQNSAVETPSPQFLVGSSDGYESWLTSHIYVAVGGAILLVGAIVYLVSR